MIGSSVLFRHFNSKECNVLVSIVSEGISLDLSSDTDIFLIASPTTWKVLYSGCKASVAVTWSIYFNAPKK